MPEPISPSILEGAEKFILYGEFGSGKTHCALTAPGPIYFLSAGAKNEAKTYYSKKFQEKVGKKEIRIDVARETVAEKGRVLEATGFDNACMLLDKALEGDAKGEWEFASIVIDNATVLETMQMAKVIKTVQGIRENPTDDGKASRDHQTYQLYKNSGILIPIDNDWLAAQSLMMQFASWLFYEVDKNIILVAHEYQINVTNRQTRVPTQVGVAPNFVGKQRTTIPNLFDNVWRMTRENGVFVARTTAKDSPYEIAAKTRVGGVIPDDYLNPNISETIQKFQSYAKSVHE